MSDDDVREGSRGDPPTSAEDEGLEELLRFVRDARGFDFTGYKRTSVGRRVHRRMQAIGISSLSAYRDLLEADVDELTSLFNTILINLTAFFRDPAAWRYLAEQTVPAIVAMHGHDEPIRFWSAGCATGEEPYSLAMTMAEHLGVAEAARRVKIYATDIDLEALALARAATYTEKTLAGVPEELRRRYFQTDVRGRGLVLVPTLRRIVVFGRHDLTRDPPISRVDLVACRNTLMYLNAETQAVVIPRLHYALREGGYLFLGRAEMVLHGGAGRFAPVSLRHRIFAALPHPVVASAATETQVSARRPFDLASFEPPSLELFDAIPTTPAPRPLSEAAFQTGPVAELLVDPDGILRGANDAARSMFGVDATTLGQALPELAIASGPVDLLGPVELALTDRSSHELGVARLTSPNGASVDVEIRALPILDERGELLGASVTFADVSGTVELREQYRHAGHGRHRAPAGMTDRHAEREDLVQKVEALNDRFAQLGEGVLARMGTTDAALATELLEELSTAVEELEVSSEEIQAQNEALSEAQREIERAAARYRELFDLAPDAYLVTDRSGVILEANQAAADQLGAPVPTLLQKPVVVFVDASDRRVVLDHLEEVATGRAEGVVTLEVRFVPPSARPFPASLHLAAGGGSEGAPTPTRVRWLVHDITARVEAEVALRASEARYRLLAESAADVVLTIDREGRVTYASPSTAAVLALEPGMLEGRPSSGLVHPDDDPAWMALQRHALVGSALQPLSGLYRVRRGQAVRHGEAPYLPMEARVTVLRSGDGRATGLRYALRDVREREEARIALQAALVREREIAATLRASDSAKDTLLLATAHDLATPASALAGLADLLLAHPDLPGGDVLRIAQSLSAAATQLRTVLTNLLDTERIVGGHLRVHCQRVDLSALVATGARALGQAGRVIELPSVPVLAEVDPGLTARIVENLLQNAVRHTSDNARVRVTLSQAVDDVLLVVDDDGPGVPDEQKHTIFEAFQRPRRHGAEGLGLGLFIVRRFAELQGGRAWVEDAPGGGASFRVQLPRGPAGGSAGPADDGSFVTSS